VSTIRLNQRAKHICRSAMQTFEVWSVNERLLLTTAVFKFTALSYRHAVGVCMQHPAFACCINFFSYLRVLELTQLFHSALEFYSDNLLASCSICLALHERATQKDESPLRVRDSFNSCEWCSESVDLRYRVVRCRWQTRRQSYRGTLETQRR